MLITGDVQAFICRDAVDMRKSIDGLSYLVEPLLAKNPLSGHLFVFVGRDRSKVKILYWGTAPASRCGTSGFRTAGFPRPRH